MFKNFLKRVICYLYTRKAHFHFLRIINTKYDVAACSLGNVNVGCKSRSQINNLSLFTYLHALIVINLWRCSAVMMNCLRSDVMVHTRCSKKQAAVKFCHNYMKYRPTFRVRLLAHSALNLHKVTIKDLTIPQTVRYITASMKQ